MSTKNYIESLLPSFSSLALSAVDSGACFFGSRRSPRSASGFVVVVGFASVSACRRFASFWFSRLPGSIPRVNIRPARGAAVSAGASLCASFPVSLDSLPLRAFAGPVACALGLPC